MKKIVLFVAIVGLAIAPAAFAQAGAAPPAKPATQTASPATPAAPAHAAAGKAHMVTAEFVTYDPVTKKVTVKDEKGQTTVAPLEGKAIAEAVHMKAGEKVVITCRDNAKGEHQAITAIKAAPAK